MYLDFVNEIVLMPMPFNVEFDTSDIHDFLNETVILNEAGVSDFISKAKRTVTDLIQRFIEALKRIAEKAREYWTNARLTVLKKKAKWMKGGGEGNLNNLGSDIMITTNKVLSPEAVVQISKDVLTALDDTFDAIDTNLNLMEKSSSDEIVDELKNRFIKQIDPKVIEANKGNQGTIPNFFFILHDNKNVSMNYDDVIEFASELKESVKYFQDLNRDTRRTKRYLKYLEQRLKEVDPANINYIKNVIANTSNHLSMSLKIRTDAVNTIEGSLKLVERAVWKKGKK